MFYNKKGEEISSEEWDILHQDMSYRALKQNDVKDNKWVSTAWIGIEHGFQDEKPLIFETMVRPKGNWLELDMQRYTTEEKALKGHKEMVNKWNNK